MGTLVEFSSFLDFSFSPTHRDISDSSVLAPRVDFSISPGCRSDASSAVSLFLVTVNVLENPRGDLGTLYLLINTLIDLF